MICVFQRDGDNLICINCSFSVPFNGEKIERTCDFETGATITKIKNFGKEVVKQGENIIDKLYNNDVEILSNKSLAEQRLKICEECEYFKHNHCELCGCITHLKVHLKKTNCPIGKW